MESGNAKLFIGGISWGTNEERLKGYFSSFGEVVESVIMKDRNTGRARGFGFVVFADPAVAERVVKEKHSIDGWMVEAKWAVPRDDLNISTKSSSSARSSPGLGRTRKIFVGGLASTVTESDFKKYFEQFGPINDVIVMYDPTTKRPRGFGFITFDKEDSVDRVLQRTFHELNGKMVEVKRAVPKELSPSPTQSPLGGYGLSRVSNILSGYNQGYLPGLVGGQYGNRIGNRFNPITYGRSEFSTYGPGYGASMNYNPGLIGSVISNDTTGFGRAMNTYTMVNTNRLGGNVNFQLNNRDSSSYFSPLMGNPSGNVGPNYVPNTGASATFRGSDSGIIAGGMVGESGVALGSSPYSARGMGSITSPHRPNSGYITGNVNHGVVDHSRSSGVNANRSSAHTLPTGVRGRVLQDSYGSGLAQSDLASGSASSDHDGLESYNYGFVAAYDSFDKPSHGYVGYGVTKRQADIGIAT
uniref:RRM domain-containing protein n=1 Tax=Kalanchoe fedtschenkoi TaxID=63787 RepID=A0A7N0RJF6_KALFE